MTPPPVHICRRCLRASSCPTKPPENTCVLWQCNHNVAAVEWSGLTPIRRCLVCGVRLAC